MTTTAESKRVGLAIVTGQKKWAGVGEGRKFNITPHGIEFLGDMDLEQWKDLMAALAGIKNSWDLCTATAVRYGLEHFGEDVVRETLAQCEFDYIDGTRALQLAQLELDFSEYTGLTSEHYFVLALAFPDADGKKDAVKWAALAKKHEMSPILLKRSIEAGKVLTNDDVAERSGRGSGGLGFLEGLGFAGKQWLKRIGGRETLLKLEREQKQRWLESVKPLVDLAKEVEESLL